MEEYVVRIGLIVSFTDRQLFQSRTPPAPVRAAVTQVSFLTVSRQPNIVFLHDFISTTAINDSA